MLCMQVTYKPLPQIYEIQLVTFKIDVILIKINIFTETTIVHAKYINIQCEKNYKADRKIH